MLQLSCFIRGCRQFALLVVQGGESATVLSTSLEERCLRVAPDHGSRFVGFPDVWRGMGWINHHRLFNLIKRTDTGLMLFNLLLLLVIVFIPYPTALLAQQYALNPEVHDAALLYSGTNVILAICFNLLWRYASYHNRLLGKDIDTRAVVAISRQYLGGPLLYLIAFGLAFVSVAASIIFLLLLALFFAIPPRKPRSLPSSDDSIRLSQD